MAGRRRSCRMGSAGTESLSTLSLTATPLRSSLPTRPEPEAYTQRRKRTPGIFMPDITI